MASIPPNFNLSSCQTFQEETPLRKLAAPSGLNLLPKDEDTTSLLITPSITTKIIKPYPDIELRELLETINKTLGQARTIICWKNFTLGARLIQEIDLLNENLEKIDLNKLKEIIREYNTLTKHSELAFVEKLSEFSSDIKHEAERFEEQLKYVYFRLQSLELSIYEKTHTPKQVLSLRSTLPSQDQVSSYIELMSGRVPPKYKFNQKYESIL